MYNLSHKPTKVDNGDIEVLSDIEMEKHNGNLEGALKDKIKEEIILPLPIIKDETQHVVSKMLDCENCFMKVMWSITNIKSSRSIWFLILMPTHFCPRIGLHKSKHSIHFNYTTIKSTPPPNTLPCWLDWDIMCASFLCPEIPLQFFQ